MASLDLSGFDAPNVTSIRYLFSGCTALEQVTLGTANPFTGKGDNNKLVKNATVKVVVK